MRYFFSRPTICFYSLFVIIAYTIPLQLPLRIASSDKIIHFLSFAMLSFLVVNYSLKAEKAYPRFCGFFYAFSLSMIIESVQLFLPYRSFQLGDAAANLLGSWLGSLILVIGREG